VIRIGPHKFTASRGEAIALATELVAAVDELEPQNGADATDRSARVNTAAET
jgi:hypothetical protein